MTYEIDATNKSLGRIATEAVVALRGKNQATFERHTAPTTKVLIKNASKLKVTGQKMTDKNYHHYSGYPGGMKVSRLEEVVTKHGFGEALKRAVYGMLPDNKLRNIAMKNLTVQE